MQVSERARTLESIMKSPLQAIEGKTPVLEALRVSERCGMHHLLLLDGARPLGVICACELEEIALGAPVRDAVHRPPLTLDIATPISDAVRSMSEEVVGSALVTRRGQAVGIVTREDAVGASIGKAPEIHCTTCGSAAHLKHDGVGGLLCPDCRSRSTPAMPDDELGGSD